MLSVGCSYRVLCWRNSPHNFATGWDSLDDILAGRSRPATGVTRWSTDGPHSRIKWNKENDRA